MENKDLFILRKAALELSATDSSQIVKIAGIRRRLSNWVKSIFFSEYGDKLKGFKENTSSLQEVMRNLDKRLDALQSAIKDGDIDDYSANYKEVVELSGELYNRLKLLGKDGSGLGQVLMDYTKDDMKSPGFVEKFTNALPDSFDIELNTVLNLPLKSFYWYKDVSPSLIHIRDSDGSSALRQLVGRVSNKLIEEKAITKDEVDNYFTGDALRIFEDNFKQATSDGSLIIVRPFLPSDKIKQARMGMVELEVTTSAFSLPGTQIKMQADVALVDKISSLSSMSKLSVKKVNRITVLAGFDRRSSELFGIFKNAQDGGNLVPRKQTPLTQLELAEALRDGYKLAFGEDPTAETLAGGWCQVMAETSGTSMYNYNMGNVMAGKSWIGSGKPYYMMNTKENDKDGKQYDLKGAKWRSFDSAADGANAFWKFLGNRYKNALQWMSAGDPVSAAASLSFNSYYTAPIGIYAKNMSYNYDSFMRKIAPQLSGLVSRPAPNPGTPVDMRHLAKDYTKEEKDALLGKSNAQDKQLAGNFDEIDALINKLYSSGSKLSSIVKSAMVKEVLPTTHLVLSVRSNTASKEEKIEFCKVASKVLREFTETYSTIHSSDSKIELQCSSVGSEDAVKNAILAICEIVSIGMKKHYNNSNIRVDVMDNKISKIAKLSDVSIDSNSRKLNLIKI